jgi:hypothetical protein
LIHPPLSLYNAHSLGALSLSAAAAADDSRRVVSTRTDANAVRRALIHRFALFAPSVSIRHSGQPYLAYFSSLTPPLVVFDLVFIFSPVRAGLFI